MDRLGTYRGYDIAVNLHSNGNRKSPAWQSSIQISLTGRSIPEPCFMTEPLDATPGDARQRAARVAMSIIDRIPGAIPVSIDDLSEEQE